MSTRTRDSATDFYAILGIAPTSSEREIRRAYHERARRLHPDVNQSPDAAERFAALAAAYDVLSDPYKRRAYDLSRLGPSTSGAWGNGSGAPEAAGQDRRLARHRDAPPPAEPSLRGQDVYQTVHLSLREAAFGVDKTVRVPRFEVCLACHGSGAAPGAGVCQCPKCHGTGRGYARGKECARCHGSGGIPTVACSSCGGTGRMESAPDFPLHFPPDVYDGEELRIKNQGSPGPQGGPRGDLRLQIVVDPDPVLCRRGSEVYADVTITPRQAMEGGTIEVPTLRSPRRLRLPRGVADGATFTMRRRGLRLKGRWRRGDQHVTIHVEQGGACHTSRQDAPR